MNKIIEFKDPDIKAVYDLLTTFYIESKSWNRAWVTQNNTIIKSPCYLGMVIATPKSNKRTNVLLYDSQGFANNEICDIGCATGVSNPINFTPPLFCSNGIYLVLDGDILGVLVVYKPVYSETEEK